MQKKIILLLLLCSIAFGTAGCSGAQQILKGFEDTLGGNGGTVTNTEIIKGLKQALEIGVGKGSNIVSKLDGYLKNPRIKIPFPKEAQKVEQEMRKLGLNKMVDKAITSLNRAAEDAAKSAKPIFVSAIRQMTIQDAMGILKGKNTEATDYLKRTTSNALSLAFKPVIDKSLNKVNATKYWNETVARYNKIPFVKKVETDLNTYVTGKAMEGLFLMVAKEETKIRKDPLARTTEVLKKVFKLQDRS